MADFKKGAVTVAVIAVAAGAWTLAAPALSHKDARAAEKSVFGIKSSESVFGYQRQARWKAIAPGLYAVTPPRGDPAFSNYALQADPDTKKVCAVHAMTKDEGAMARLRRDLVKTYGEPSQTSPTGWRWSKGPDFVAVDHIEGQYQVVWDFTGDCGERNTQAV